MSDTNDKLQLDLSSVMEEKKAVDNELLKVYLAFTDNLSFVDTLWDTCIPDLL